MEQIFYQLEFYTAQCKMWNPYTEVYTSLYSKRSAHSTLVVTFLSYFAKLQCRSHIAIALLDPNWSSTKASSVQT